MSDTILSQLTMFNQLYKELDDLYYSLARHYGLTYSALWILYSITENDTPYTQTGLCEKWFYSKQTVNSTLKNLESSGFIQLVSAQENRKNKLVLLTEAGKELVQKTIIPMKKLEQCTFGGLEETERREYLRIAQKHVALFRRECRKVFESPND